MTPRRRRAMSFQLMPVGDNLFNGKQNILGKAYFEGLRVGDTLVPPPTRSRSATLCSAVAVSAAVLAAALLVAVAQS